MLFLALATDEFPFRLEDAAIKGTSGRLVSGCCDFRDKKDLKPLSHIFLGGVSKGLTGILSWDTPGLPDARVNGGDLDLGDG